MSTQTDYTMELARTRRHMFADELKERGVTCAAHVTEEVQRAVFEKCESLEERGAFRQYLMIEYRMTLHDEDAPTDSNTVLTDAMLGYKTRLTEGVLA